MFKTYFGKQNRSVLSFIVAIVVFLQGVLCYANDFTLEQLVNGVNFLREDIQSGELLVSIIGYEAPLMTAAEGQQWIAERKAELRRDIDQRTEGDPQFDGDRHYNFHLKQYSEMLQRLIDKIQFHREKSVAFEVYGPPPRFGQRTGNFRYRSVMNNRLIDRSKPYYIPNYYISIFDGETQKIAYEHKYENADSENRHVGDQESEFDVYDQFGRGLATIPLDAARLVRQETINDVRCYLVEFQLDTLAMLVRYWIAPAEGYCILKAEYIVKRTGFPPVIHQVVYNSDFRQFSEGIWYPTQRTVTAYWLEGSRQGEIKSEERFEVKEAVFNLSFPADFFQIDSEATESLGVDSTTTDRNAQISDASSLALLECGPRSLLTICNFLGVDASFEELAELSAFSPETGTTMAGLYTAAQSKNLNPVGVKTSITDLQRLEMPVIAHVNQDHFLVVTRIEENNVYCQDPVGLHGTLSLDEFEKIWGGYLLLFTVDKKTDEAVAGIEPSLEKQQPVPRKVEVSPPTPAEANLPVAVESPIHDFGQVFGGTEVEHIFTFTNRGEDVLEITDVESSCYCTTGFLSDTRIPPGGIGRIKVAFKAPPRPEVVNEIVKLTTNQPQIPHFELAVKATIITPFETIPANLLLGRISPDSFAGRHLLLRKSLEHKAKVVDIKPSSQYIVAKPEPPTRNGNVRVLITVEAGMPVGSFTERLQIDFVYDGHQYASTVPILGEILGDVAVSPKQLFLGLVKPLQVSKKRVQLSRIRGEQLEISAVHTDSKYIDAKLETVEVGDRYEVLLSIASGAPEGDLTDTLTVRTNSKNQPELKIPIYGVVKKDP